MIATGEIAEAAAVTALLEAGRALGLPDAELIGTGHSGTIFSGLHTGRRAAAR